MDRKGRKAIKLGLVLLGGDSEEKEDYTGGDLPWRLSRSSHRWGTSVLGSEKEGDMPSWLVGGPLGLTR